VKSEQAVREQLQRDWPNFSAADKQHCVALAMTGGESRNTELLTCLEMARDVRALRSAASTPSGADMTKQPASSPSLPTVQTRACWTSAAIDSREGAPLGALAVIGVFVFWCDVTDSWKNVLFRYKTGKR
jgi:hypothetical protein